VNKALRNGTGLRRSEASLPVKRLPLRDLTDFRTALPSRDCQDYVSATTTFSFDGNHHPAVKRPQRRTRPPHRHSHFLAPRKSRKNTTCNRWKYLYLSLERKRTYRLLI
jgi:hypothetical protein